MMYYWIMIRKTLAFSERLIDMVQEIRELKGYPTFSSVIHQAIIELHSKHFPAYARVPKEVRTPKEKAQEKVAIKTAQEQIAREDLIKICNKLGGEIIGMEGDAREPVCRYFTYNFKNKYEQEVPIDQLSADLIKNQYHPSKQRVEDLMKTKKKKA